MCCASVAGVSEERVGSEWGASGGGRVESEWRASEERDVVVLGASGERVGSEAEMVGGGESRARRVAPPSREFPFIVKKRGSV